MSEPVISRGNWVRNTTLGVGIVAVAFLVLLVFARTGPRDTAESNLLGKPAPVVETKTLDGATFNLSHRKGSWVLLNFFNSTCVPCVRENPELVKFMDEESTREEPAELYTVINDDSDDAVREFFNKNGGSWTKIKDDDGAIAVAFGVAKVPETWIIDPNGYVRMRITGEVTAEFLVAKLLEFRTQASG